jgi:hypothetical protein
MIDKDDYRELALFNAKLQCADIPQSGQMHKGYRAAHCYLNTFPSLTMVADADADGVSRSLYGWKGEIGRSTLEMVIDIEKLERLTAELAKQFAEEDAAEVEALALADAEKQERAKLAAIRQGKLSQPSLLCVKTKHLSATRSAAMAMLIKQSRLEPHQFHLVVQGLRNHGLDAEQAINDCIYTFADNVKYNGYSFSFDITEFDAEVDLDYRP